MQNLSNSPTQARLLSDMEKCSEIVYSLLEVDQKQSEQHSRKHVLNEAKLPTTVKTSRHRKKMAVTQNPPPAKRHATNNTRVGNKQNSTTLTKKDKPDDLPTKLSASHSDVTLRSTTTDYTLPPTSSITSPAVISTVPAYSSQTSSHLLSLATQRLMQSLAHRLDPSRSSHLSLPYECQGLLPQLMAVIQLLDSTNPNPLPLPPALSSTFSSDLGPQVKPLSTSDLKAYSHSLLPIRHEVGTNTENPTASRASSEIDQLRSEVTRLKDDRCRLSEQCQRLENCLRRLRTNRDELAHQLSQTTRQRNSLNSALQQLKGDLNDFEERNRIFSSELERGNELYSSSVRSLNSSIHLLDPAVTHSAELDSLSVGTHVSETIIAKEAELRRVKSKCGEYKDILLHTHRNLLKSMRDTNSSQPVCIAETVRELENFVKRDKIIDSSAVSSVNSYVRQTPEKPSASNVMPVCSTLTNESAFEDRLYQLDAQISKLQLNINQSRDQLH
ncbi:hypothetical protein LOD99_8760 [Oopsacas minuta]|uniref:Uncharacterized protein n=1 Tax=Oopsacas minuta TaxID=111878 RepID=A0AAV7JFM3_9METZ|nr:hypothetical protein LOD99_8760 [Oopsacas minuta]